MRIVKVASAIIRDGDKILSTQRGHGEYKGFWEFPGGKLEPGETAEQALIRELREELEVEVEVGELAEQVEFDYPDFHLTMYCYWCKLISEDMVLVEHLAARWLSAEELDDVKWLPADRDFIARLKQILTGGM